MTFKTFNANVGAYPHHFPVIAATGVCFAQANYVAGFYIHDHFAFRQELIWLRMLSAVFLAV
ncbi:unnamed protein product [marine sediment metagenome]|uniref:Uncharacterized protein n=1 Tax=marine sediment metagenome TaxID=412755 RepID=X1UY78_9ZZZZ